jgi:hypothetical protein
MRRVGFFDAYRQFFLTSTTGATPNRLNKRYDAIIDWNRDLLAGTRVLDLASHDGRWAFAALTAGAAHVLGVEAREHLAASAKSNLRSFDARRWEVRTGDVLDCLSRLPSGGFDVVLCLGFFYHTTEHTRLLGEIRRLAPRWLIIDGLLSPLPGSVVELRKEDASDDAASIDTFATGKNLVLVGVPSRDALIDMLRQFGFEIEHFDWGAQGITDWRDIEDYRDGLRITVRCRARP